MILRTSNILRTAENTSILRRSLTLVSGLTALVLLAATQANAQPVHFRYVGGRWSHTRHAGWNRYWGGPSIGFYYAPAPVYVVPGYAAPSYYTGPDFWTSNPSFGISLNFGGGGYYGGGYRSDRYYHGGYDHARYYSGRPRGDYHGNYGNYHGDAHYSGGGRYFGGRSSGEGHSFGDRGRR